jgi:hypothetical protein
MPVIDTVEPVSIADLGKDIVIPRQDFEAWLEKWDWTIHQVARREFPAPYTSLEEFQLACICADPVLWVQAFLREPEDPDHQDPFGLWEYQKAALRYRGSKVYDCGAETGKTRDIIADNLYCAFTVPNGSGIVGAPQQTHLDEIIEAMTDQLSWNDDLQSSLRRHKKSPHHGMYFTNGFKIDFRPSGHDGEAFRGVHVRTFAKLDEAAKMKNSKQWSEFWRAMKPGAIAAIYSVTDGDRSCDFYRLKERAKGSVAAAQPNQEESPELKAMPAHLKRLVFRHFKWPKTMMPYPYWSEERRQFYIEQFNGEDSPGYKHNVLAEDGDPEYSVFPWEQLRHCVKEIPEYRCLKILVEAERNDVVISGYKYEMVAGESGPIPRRITLIDTTYKMRGFFDYSLDGKSMIDSEFRRLIKNFFSNVPGLKRGGADFGFSGDPTELIVNNIIGKTRRRVARLQLKHVTYDQQCQALDALDDVYGPKEAMSWGTDFGNAGSAVAHDLQGLPQYSHKQYVDRLRGFQFESTTDNIDTEGNPVIDSKDGKPVKITLKELATDHMTKNIQRLDVEYPPDPDILTYYPNHTVNYSGKHRIYKKQDDHLIDADRAETLAGLLGENVEDFFSCGGHKR